MQFITLQIITVVIAGLMVGNELAVSAFVHPQLYRLDDQYHAATSKALALLTWQLLSMHQQMLKTPYLLDKSAFRLHSLLLPG